MGRGFHSKLLSHSNTFFQTHSKLKGVIERSECGRGWGKFNKAELASHRESLQFGAQIERFSRGRLSLLAARAPHPARHVVSGLRSYYFRLAAATLLPVLYVRAQFISNLDGNNLHSSS